MKLFSLFVKCLIAVVLHLGCIIVCFQIPIPDSTQDQLIKNLWGFPGGAVVKNLPANAGDMGSSPGLGRSHMPRSN